MILLDTNVVSEAIKPVPSPVAMAWLDGVARDALYLPSPVLAELHAGVRRLPEGRRRRELEAWVDALEAEWFPDRVLPFDARAARAFGVLVADRVRAGRGIEPIDAMIAAIARVHGATVATRNTADFEGLGIDVVDPFAPMAPIPGGDTR